MANPDALDSRDATLQVHAPAVMVPRFGKLDPLEHSGHRYLVANDGLWLEVQRPWLRLRWPLAPSLAPLPYGPLDEAMEFGFDWNDFWLLVEVFRHEATKALPNEHAAWFVWNERSARLEYQPLLAIDVGPGGIKLHRPALEAHEHLAVDVHSHGGLAAFFSATDDADDAGEVKLALVLGNLDREMSAHSEALRLCAQGLVIPFADGAEPACRVCGCTENEPCPDGCSWVAPDLCSACVET